MKQVKSATSVLALGSLICLLLSGACATQSYKPASAPASPSAAPVSPAAGAAPKASPVEAEFWSSVKDSKDPAQLEAYLKRYPSGAFVEEAQKRLAALKAR